MNCPGAKNVLFFPLTPISTEKKQSKKKRTGEELYTDRKASQQTATVATVASDKKGAELFFLLSAPIRIIYQSAISVGLSVQEELGCCNGEAALVRKVISGYK